MDESARNDIRKMLKIFGVQADEAISNHLEPIHMPGSQVARELID